MALLFYLSLFLSGLLGAAAQGYADPTAKGGSWLTRLNSTSTLGEPINIVISSNSDAVVLTPSGILDYYASLYYSPGNCAGISAGGAQQANLGDGNGYHDQADVMRFNYYQGSIGSCIESVQGGNHFRYWAQNGTQADTGAIFMSASLEMDASQQHNIVANGYNLGRDLIVNNATNSSGTMSPGGNRYRTTATQITSSGINQAKINHGIAIDGHVAVLTVRSLGAKSFSSASVSSSTMQSTSSGLAMPTGQVSASRLCAEATGPIASICLLITTLILTGIM